MVWLEGGLHLDTYSGIGVPVHPDIGVSWTQCETELGTIPNSQVVSCPDGHHDTTASPDSSMIQMQCRSAKANVLCSEKV